jgi:hypothetical protein
VAKGRQATIKSGKSGKSTVQASPYFSAKAARFGHLHLPRAEARSKSSKTFWLFPGNLTFESGTFGNKLIHRLFSLKHNFLYIMQFPKMLYPVNYPRLQPGVIRR